MDTVNAGLARTVSILETSLQQVEKELAGHKALTSTFLTGGMPDIPEVLDVAVTSGILPTQELQDWFLDRGLRVAQMSIVPGMEEGFAVSPHQEGSYLDQMSYYDTVCERLGIEQPSDDLWVFAYPSDHKLKVVDGRLEVFTTATPTVDARTQFAWLHTMAQSEEATR